MIAKVKKPYRIREKLIKPSMSKAADPVLIKTYSKRMSKIFLSDSTIKTPIHELDKKDM